MKINHLRDQLQHNMKPETRPAEDDEWIDS